MVGKITGKDDNILYYEWVPMNIFVTIAIILLVTLLVATSISIPITQPTYRALTIVICVIFSIFFILLWLNFRGLSITITKSEIIVKFGIFSKKIIPVNEIISLEETKVSFKTYWGFGIRIGFDSSLAYTTGFTKAIKIISSEKRPFVFSTKTPH
ncbi:MAG: hypothetical protein FK734_20420 [Asgard group archaeon]|nr:hypothetical protein [Asgard group archaeon]